MDYYTLVFGSIFSLIFLYILAKLSSRGTKKLPPGPSPWPIIGNLHVLGAKPHTSLANLAKKYGPIMSLKLGQITIVIISSSTIAKQVLKIQDQAFSTYRFIPNAIQAHNYCKFSVAFLPVCPQWRTLKRILNKNIFSSNSLDANQHLRSQKVKELIDYCTKCSQQDSKVELKEVLKNIIDEMGNPNLVDFFPILEKIDLQGIRRRTTIHIGKLFKLFDGLINERLEENRRFQSEKSDVLDVFLDICEENPEEINHNYIKSVFLVLVNVWEICRDSTFWEDPLVFKPERFLHSNLGVRGQDFELIPFGVGRRICPALPLTLRMIPVMLGSLLNSFNWKLEAGIEPEDLDMEE
ncbi:hypothetical protein KY290_037919 [Solanum tuberosum]|uniref:Cytochrome P450 n=1 Tax=Solanum tuberosum TaxID=4113 RepID=A0ABQ7TY51_SOLTU|nr:hypothetical protein KY290_037919 [Solanum tuberosum]